MQGTAICYKCTYRGAVPGDYHSCCNYPGTEGMGMGMLSFFSKQNIEIRIKLNIQADSCGVAQGWFMWPVNFDPIWLDNCDGFKEKENE